MRIYLKKQNFCKRGLVATFEFIKLFDALSVKKVAEGGSAVLKEEDWIPLSLEAKRISLSSDLLKLKRKELEELVDSVRKVSLEVYSQFSRDCINSTRFC